jgi:hypothetical protein
MAPSELCGTSRSWCTRILGSQRKWTEKASPEWAISPGVRQGGFECRGGESTKPWELVRRYHFTAIRTRNRPEAATDLLEVGGTKLPLDSSHYALLARSVTR